MSRELKRRDFLKRSSAIAAGAACVGLGTNLAAAEKAACSSPKAAALGWLVGVQQYTFRRFNFYEMLDRMSDLGIQHAEACFFLRLDEKRPELKVSEDLSAEVRKELKKRMADHGVSMSAFYSNLSADADQAKRIFEFCREMETPTIVAEPPAEAFDMIEKLCDEYEIDLAVHNHPKSPNSKYWNPEAVLAVCKGRGKRIGGCCDTGHWVRSALDPVACLKKMEGRVLSFHLKDVIEVGNPAARDVPLGTGKGNYSAVLKELNRQGYRGTMTIEYEHDSPELMDDVAACVAFVEKTAASLK
jgi:L-ribulose-5-phosphate 3-epimerase